MNDRSIMSSSLDGPMKNYLSVTGNLSRMVVIFIFSLFMLNVIPSFNIPELPDIIDPVSGALTQSSPIVIENDFGLGVHPSVRSGGGTSQDPYIISDYSIDCTFIGRGAIAIRNTTSYLIIRNITITASSSAPAIYLRAWGWNSQNIVLKNIISFTYF